MAHKVGHEQKVSKSHWQAARDKLFPEPALTKCQRIEAKPTVLRTRAEVAFLEGYDLGAAYPHEVTAIYEGLIEGRRRALRGGQAA